MNAPLWFSQEPYRCRLGWGRAGAAEAAARGDVLVVVDVLRFSSAVATAVHGGARVFPRAVGSGRTGGPTRYALSPLTYVGVSPRRLVVLSSPNGATCARVGGDVPALYAGALLNARAVAEAVARRLETNERGVTVLACGERLEPPTEDGALRFALEDFLGAGAILAHLPFDKSPEAEACALAFLGSQSRLGDLLWDCGSGRELRDKGYAEDVRFAAQLDLYDSVPLLRNGAFGAE